MENKKKFCSSCIYFSSAYMEEARCSHPSNIKEETIKHPSTYSLEAYETVHESYRTKPKILNMYNDCKNHQEYIISYYILGFLIVSLLLYWATS